MSDLADHGHTPAEEDPVLDAMLASLPLPPQRHNLEDRVLSGVFRPAPRWLRRARSAWQELHESGRIWMVVGSLAAGSVLPLAGLAVGIRFAAPRAGDLLGFGTREVIPYVHAALSAQAASLIETIRGPVDALALTGPEWFGWVSAIAVACVGCSWGLYRTMTPRAARK
jgi:hypothetical protein